MFYKVNDIEIFVTKGGIYQAACEQSVFKVHVVDTGKMGKCVDLCDFNKGQIDG